MRHKFYDNPKYKKKQAEITHKYWQRGVFNFKRKANETRLCKNPNCTLPFQAKPGDHKIFCSRNCSAKINNLTRKRNPPPQQKLYSCHTCGTRIYRYAQKYCSIKCQVKSQYENYIKSWKLGKEDGSIGISTHFLSGHIKHYFRKKYGDKCSLCGWNQINPVTKKVPLEIDHIDGNASNNKEENLRLICPNCHSLTPHFRNLNKGNGRSWRQKQSKIV